MSRPRLSDGGHTHEPEIYPSLVSQLFTGEGSRLRGQDGEQASVHTDERQRKLEVLPASKVNISRTDERALGTY